MKIPTLAETIANDLARKCGDDVGAAIQRTFRLCDSQGACTLAAITAAAIAMANVTGAMWAEHGKDLDGKALDKVWRDLIRPLALSTMGDRGPFLAMLETIAAKPERIDGGDA